MAQNLFKWKHFESEIILLCVRWYLKYPLSYRMLVEMMQERGLKLTHTTIMRWVHQYSPIIDIRIRKHLKPTNDSWRMDETYLKIKGRNALNTCSHAFVLAEKDARKAHGEARIWYNKLNK